MKVHLKYGLLEREDKCMRSTNKQHPPFLGEVKAFDGQDLEILEVVGDNAAVAVVAFPLAEDRR